MNPEAHEELKKQLLASLEETKRLAAEARQRADEVEADLLRALDPGSATDAVSASNTTAPTMAEREQSLAEMRAYIDKVKLEIEEQRAYRHLPWWRRLFKTPPPYN